MDYDEHGDRLNVDGYNEDVAKVVVEKKAPRRAGLVSLSGR